MMNLLTLAGLIAVVIAILLVFIRYQTHQLKGANHRIDTLETHNQMLQQELKHAKTRQAIEQDTHRLSDTDVDNRLREQGYFRD